jgi:hypothetical protein
MSKENRKLSFSTGNGTIVKNITEKYKNFISASIFLHKKQAFFLILRLKIDFFMLIRHNTKIMSQKQQAEYPYQHILL